MNMQEFVDNLRKILELEGGYASLCRLEYRYRLPMKTLLEIYEDKENNEKYGIKSLYRNYERYLLLRDVNEDIIEKNAIEYAKKLISRGQEDL